MISGILVGVGAIFLGVAAFVFQATPVSALFYAAIGFALMVPGAAMTLGKGGVVLTAPPSFFLAVTAVILQMTHP